jgi:hypothetical protein
MASHIPFVHNQRDARLVRSTFADSEIVRLSLATATNVINSIPDTVGIWIDGAVDGFDRWPVVSDDWKAKFVGFKGAPSIGDTSFQKSPKPKIVDEFVSEVLDACLAAAPRATWLSVPQLPAVGDGSRNKINRRLAEATATWRKHRRFSGKLILPIILSDRKHSVLKTQRNQRIKLAAECFQRSDASGYWVVEAGLSDQSGVRNLATQRLPGLIGFHKEIATVLGTQGPSVSGPYWALNLVLWARGLVTHPAIGVGVGYQYHIPGGTQMRAKSRIALSSLRRWATVSAQLENWLKSLPRNDPGLSDLTDLIPHFRNYFIEEQARSQVARFYKSWFDRINATQPIGRALALYQDFSTAYVLGKQLDDLPRDEGTARRPERIAEQFMLHCL